MAAKELDYFGIRSEIRNKRISRSGFGFALSYMGPLYEGRDITKGLVRGMARDLYDLWFLLERGIEPDIELINSKLALYHKWDGEEIMAMLIWNILVEKHQRGCIHTHHHTQYY